MALKSEEVIDQVNFSCHIVGGMDLGFVVL